MTQDRTLFPSHLLSPSSLPSLDYSGFWKYAARPDLKKFSSSDKTGKWCIFSNKDQVDQQWELIKKSCQNGDLLVAKCSTALGAMSHQGHHVICVYTEDFNNQEEVFKTRDILRDLGFTEELGYKTDAATMARVYGTPDEWTYRR